MKGNYLPSLLMGVLALAGCRAHQGSLPEFVATAERQAQVKVLDLKPALDFKTGKYSAHYDRKPFALPQAALVLNQPQARKDCWQPIQRKRVGPLETFDLEKLRLKGVMSKSGSNSALVQTPSGIVVKVEVGQFIGLNNGKVTQVNADYIQVNETLPDGLGCWSRRNVKLALK
ncbi:pilus assembly protein PilP [Vibrio intestinalis]|uniref:pilus assembly protein PilP n=1 Tax=Vibrio intestinalis TaxID=2933291 RepID=UPI0021A9535B|nr:pilus assembly protein PilP [Vibrio intestinalis]